MENNLKDVEAERFNLVARLCRKAIRYDKPICGCELKKIASLPIALAAFGDEFFSNQKVLDCIYSQFGLHAPNLGVTAVNSGVGMEVISVVSGSANCSQNKITVTFDYVGINPSGNLITVMLYSGGTWIYWYSINDILSGANTYTATGARPPGLIGDIPVKVTDANSGYESPTVIINFGICDSLSIGTAVTFCPYDLTPGPFAAVQLQVTYTLLPPSNDIYIEYYDGANWQTFYHVGNIGDVTGITAFSINPPILCAGQTIQLRIKDVDTGFVSTTYSKSFNTCS